MTALWPGIAPAGAASLEAHVVQDGDGLATLGLFVDGVNCGGCVARIERALVADPRIVRARLNLSTRRLEIAWRGPRGLADQFSHQLAEMGHAAVPWLPEDVADRARAREHALLLDFGIAVFALANVMMLAWAVWLGHAGDMGPGTRAFFHWLQALVAVPAILWAGRSFYASAFAALKARRTNMDVPISAGVLLTMLMSLSETARHGPHVYFDGALALLSVLLLGRWLDQRMRSRTRSGVQELAMMAARPVTLQMADGRTESVPASHVQPGQALLVAAGERIGADGVVIVGEGDIDTSLVTGEWAPRPVAVGDHVAAGTLNLGAPLTIRAERPGKQSTLFEMVRLLEAAEQKQGRHVALADRVVRIYTPVVHLLAALTFLGWLLLGDSGWQLALVHAVTVLIIACPCALGLAVPAAQVAAASRLMKAGILIASDSALERAAKVDTILFDKTGTLTLPGATLFARPEDPAIIRISAAMAASSRHPLARAIHALAPDVPALDGVDEIPGKGLRWQSGDGEVRLGAAAWCGIEQPARKDGALEAWLVLPGKAPARFAMASDLRPDAVEAVAHLQAMGLETILLSGDRSDPARLAAELLGIARWHAGVTPAGKLALVERLQAEGRSVMMVGDGLNDAAALAIADASLAPGTAADASRRLADAVWMGPRLMPVATHVRIARKTRAIIRQNIGFSFVYNAIWVPVAMAGLVTPWIAAAAMSASSILVTLNALRLSRGRA